MAGKKNHILPKWLQKEFASRTDGEEVFTWVYRINSKPFETNIGNSNAENYFYGRIGELNADDVMTDAETYKFSPLINKLRDATCNFADSKTEIAELIAHFSIRTKVVRKGFEDMSGKQLKGYKDILTNDETVSNVLLKPSEEQLDNIFDEALNVSSPEMDEALAIFKLVGLEKDSVKELIRDSQNEETKDVIQNIFTDFLSNIFDGMIETLPNAIKDGHNKALANYTIPQPRVEKYEQLNWSIHETDLTLVLGDVACIFKEIGEKSFKSSCELDKTGQVYLPISSNQILIGTLDSEEIETDTKILNRAIASCSYEQFVCCENTDDKVELIKIIGTNAHLTTDEEIENELEDISNNLQRIKDERDE